LSTSRFQTREEYHFFQLYVTETAAHLSGFYSPTLWSQIVLQASEAEESIRHAVISIGALDMTALSGGKRTKSKIPKEIEDHHVFALSQYSKAINSLQQNVFSKDYDLRTALVASLLIVCFETYHGNYESANRQTKTAIKLIEAHYEALPPSGRKREVGIEEDLRAVFERLEIQSMSQTDSYTLPEHLRMMNCNADLLATMPAVFEDVATARRYFNFVIRQTMHFACACWKVHSTPQTPPPFSHPTLSSATPNKPSLSYFDAAVPCTTEFLRLGAEKFEQVERWMKAFRPLFDENRKFKGSKDYLAVSAQRTQYLVTYIALSTMGTMIETTYDKYFDLFLELVDLGQDMCFPLHHLNAVGKGDMEENNGGQEMFFFDMQIVMPLDFVAKKCRDPALRRRAIWLMKAKPRRENFWDSVVAAMVCEWVVGVEEENMVDGVIWEESRARDVGVKLELEGIDEVRKARVWCTLGTGERRERLLEW
jgi:Fungal specific transcription factor domain